MISFGLVNLQENGKRLKESHSGTRRMLEV